MIKKIVNTIQESMYLKHFIVSLIVAVFITFTTILSTIMWAAVSVSLLPVIANLPFFDDKLTYDQRQHLTSNPLLLSSILWSVFMWFYLQDYLPIYTLIFVSLTMSAFTFIKPLQQKLFIVLPILITTAVLLGFINTPPYISIAGLMVTLTLLLLLLANNENVDSQKTKKESNDYSIDNKMELVSQLDEVNTENGKLVDKFKQMEIDLSAAEMAKMEFLATMSHEIRTPLNGIIPLLDILLDSDMSDFQKDYLSTAHVSAIQMQKLIDDLLDYSKVEAGKLSMETRGLKVPRILEAVKSSYLQAAEKKNIKIEVGINSNISPLLRGDPTRLRQVLSNLVSNAIKFSSSGIVKITAKKIKDFPNKEIIRFKVIDQGIGLDKETSDNIFLAFTQEDGSSTRKFGGTGLGLAISKKIVELMNGNIDVESKKGKGSTFFFDLPLLKSVGETVPGTFEISGFQAIIINTNPLLFNKISQNLKTDQVTFQKALGLSQAYDMYASINKVSKESKNILLFIDFETAGKQVRSLCNDIANDKSMGNLFACILSENTTIAGIPQHTNIKHMTKDDSISQLLDRIAISQASMEESGATNTNAQQFDDENKIQQIQITSEEVLSKIQPEILLVEDNEVNLKVAEKLIQYIGYPFDFAMNGQEALEKVKNNRYRMILMDCQMPIMDGYRCTSKIRDYELAADLNHTPILAMTANAMMGDREKCLEAGMDDYMSKPLNRYILEKTLKKWDPLDKTNESEKPKGKQTKKQKDNNDKEQSNNDVIVDTSISEQSNASNDEKIEDIIAPKKTPVNINQKWLSTKVLAGLEEIMGEEIVQLLQMFEQETPSIIKKISSALNESDFDGVQKMAHMLKSTSSNVGANGLSFFSRKMELAAGNNDKEQLTDIFEKIRKAYVLTSKEISKYVSSL